jgi:hypothetical protein
MNINRFIIGGLIVFSVFCLTGCFEKDNGGESIIDTTKKDRAVTSCQIECRGRKDIEDFSLGPCLSNAIQPDWICDIAHNPRQAVDNDSANQCSAYREGVAHHFVELDSTCQLIRAE